MVSTERSLGYFSELDRSTSIRNVEKRVSCALIFTGLGTLIGVSRSNRVRLATQKCPEFIFGLTTNISWVKKLCL